VKQKKFRVLPDKIVSIFPYLRLYFWVLFVLYTMLAKAMGAEGMEGILNADKF
jgi:hypothetical protein